MICTHLYCFVYSYQMRIIFKPMYLTHRWYPNCYDQSGAESNGYKIVLHTIQIYRSGASPFDAVYGHYGGGLLPEIGKFGG